VTDLQDVLLDKDAGPSPPASRSSVVGWAIATLFFLAAAGLGWYAYRHQPASVSPAKPAAAVPAPTTRAPLGVATPAVELPPLDQSDAFVRELVRGLSAHPIVTAWLATNGLLRNVVAVVENVATGGTPARQLRVLAPRGRFLAIERGGRAVIDPASYRRYDAIAAAFGSIDPAGTARVYSTLKPRIEEAYRELGRDESFDRTLEAAIVSLLQVPVVDGDVTLISHGALYRFGDTRLEGLTAAQKQLLRMGPDNVRTVQRKLRQLADALGIPGERLPR